LTPFVSLTEAAFLARSDALIGMSARGTTKIVGSSPAREDMDNLNERVAEPRA
jgi:hypothetical protein